MAIEAQVPAWLQRNWAPRESIDPLPWLQAGYARAIDQQTIPLKIQALNLQNQAAQVDMAKASMDVELQGMQMAQYAAELPLLQEVKTLAATNPNAFRNRPVSFQSPLAQKEYMNLRKMVAETDYAKAADKNIIADIELANKISGTINYVVKRLPDGTVDREDLAVGLEMMAAENARRFERQHPSVSASAATPDVTEKQAIALERARERVKKAYTAGNADEIADAELFLSNLRDAQDRQHPDKLEGVEFQMLMTKYRALANTYSVNPTNKKVTEEMAEIEKQIRAIRSGKAQPSAGANNDPLGLFQK